MATGSNMTAVKENLPRRSTAFGICARSGIMPVQNKVKGGALAMRNLAVPVRAKASMSAATGLPQRSALKEIHNKTITTKVGTLCKEVTNISIRPKQDKALKPVQVKVQRPLQNKTKKPIQEKEPVAVREEAAEQCKEVKERSRKEAVDKLERPATKTEEIVAVAEKSKDVVEAAPLDQVSYSTLLLPVEVEDIDKADEGNLLLVPNYIDDIYKYLRKLEAKFSIKRDHLSCSKVTARMRSILVNWLIEVHHEFRLLPETLYLTVSILDRFLQEDLTVTQTTLQLVGSTAMLVASKYEEMVAPEITDFVYVSKDAFTKEDVMKMEFVMLKALNLSLGCPSPVHFLRRFSKAAKATADLHTLAKYVLELCLVDYNMCHVPPSHQAAAALYTALYALSASKSKGFWSSTLQHYTQYSEAEVLPVARKMAAIVVAAPVSKYQTVYKKYSTSKFGKVSVRVELTRLKSLAS